MKLEYLPNVSSGDQVPSVSLIRLYGFTPEEVKLLIDIIQDKILDKHLELDLSSINFIEPLNCNLFLRLSSWDDGITSKDKKNNIFLCSLTQEGYQTMISFMAPFSERLGTSGSDVWLCDRSKEKIDFLFSRDGMW